MLLENFIITNVMYTLHREVFRFVVHSKRVGWHNDEHWLKLIITCSFIDITNFT